MEEQKFRSRVSKETWLRLQAVLQHLRVEGVTAPPLCVACPDSTDGQIFVLHEAGTTKFSNRIPKDGKWLHQTLRAMEGRMQEKFLALKEEREERAQMAQAAVHAAKAVEKFHAAKEAAEVAVYETEIHMIVRRTEPLPRKGVALPEGSTWKWSDLKSILVTQGAVSRDEALGLVPMKGREASEARMEASFTRWLCNLAMEGRIVLDEWDNISLV